LFEEGQEMNEMRRRFKSSVELDHDKHTIVEGWNFSNSGDPFDSSPGLFLDYIRVFEQPD